MKEAHQLQTKEVVFKQLFEKYYAPFCLYAKRFIDDSNVRQDIVSEIFASLWDRLNDASFELQSENILGYIKFCVRNRCINYLKHLECEQNYSGMIQEKAPVYEKEADSVYTLEELYRMLYNTLEKLPETHRIVFNESFFNNKSHTEIAEELNISVKSVYRYKLKTLELLRKDLKDFLPLILFLLKYTQ